MGAVKRIIYNELLMNRADYSNKNKLIALFKNIHLLKELGGEGDQVALSIYIDLKGMLGKDKGCGFKTPLLKEEADLLNLYLIGGYNQSELARYYNISQMSVSNRVNKALEKLTMFWEIGGQ